MKPLLILDMDETLIKSECFPDDGYVEEGCFDISFKSDGYFYYTKKRPFLDEFIKYAFENFNVAVWTAASEDYATNVIKNILNMDKLEFFFTRDRCTMKQNVYGDYYGVKNLTKLKNKFGFENSLHFLDRVLIIDDVAETAVNNYGNLILIKSFIGDPNDTELLKLISYLEKIKDQPNYRKIEKRGWSL